MQYEMQHELQPKTQEEQKVEINPILLKHAQIVQDSKASLVKMITVDFANALLAIDPDFCSFTSSGIAARISNIAGCYTMFVNSLDRQPEKKQKIIAISELSEQSQMP